MHAGSDGGLARAAPAAVLRRVDQQPYLHIYLLHGPDFLGDPDIMTVAADHRDAVERGLALKKTGNELMELIGGRADPSRQRPGRWLLLRSGPDISGDGRRAAPGAGRLALETVAWVAGFVPDVDRRARTAGGADRDRYPPSRTGSIARSGLRCRPGAVLTTTSSRPRFRTPPPCTPPSTAGSDRSAGPVFAEPPAAVPALAREAAATAGLGNSAKPVPQHRCSRRRGWCSRWRRRCGSSPSTAARTTVHRITPRAGVGHGISEAPRGLLPPLRVRCPRDIKPPASSRPLPESGCDGHDLATMVASNTGLDDAALTTLCEDDSLLRPVHLVCRALPDGDGPATMTVDDVVVIGVGNRYRRDDGVGDRRGRLRDPQPTRSSGVDRTADPTATARRLDGHGTGRAGRYRVWAPPARQRAVLPPQRDFDGIRANSSRRGHRRGHRAGAGAGPVAGRTGGGLCRAAGTRNGRG